MTDPSPLPPPVPVNGSTIRVRAVMFGQAWTDPNGVENIAEENIVLLEFLQDGAPIVCRIQTPESAIAIGRLLVDAAGRCFRDDVDDTGKKLPAAERMSRFNAAWAGRKS